MHKKPDFLGLLFVAIGHAVPACCTNAVEKNTLEIRSGTAISMVRCPFPATASETVLGRSLTKRKIARFNVA